MMRANIPRRLSTLITKDRASSNPKHKSQLSNYIHVILHDEFSSKSAKNLVKR